MTDFMWYCQRCGNVGFHSEACITATVSEDMAARKAVAAERARISDGLRALHERLSNEAKPKRKMCECGHPMNSHAGGWVLLHHDFFIVDRLAAAIVNPEAANG